MQLVDRAKVSAQGKRRFCLPYFDPTTARRLRTLWEKYADELSNLSSRLAIKFQEINGSGLSAAFGDLEGELLYILVRELKPDLIFEISPNSGYSTNYILAALTRNEKGRVESFEIIEAFNGVATDATIRRHLVDICDPRRLQVFVGDARVAVLRRLAESAPTLTLLDSCHEDFFGEFYIKALLPRLTGTVVIQDILHFDPRPHWTTEGMYVVSWLYESGLPFLPLAIYEDTLVHHPARQEIAVRRPFRSNSIVLSLGDTPARPNDDAAVRLLASIERERAGRPPELDPVFPLNSTRSSPELRARFRDGTHPADRYTAALFGGVVNREAPSFADVMALRRGQPMDEPTAQALLASFDSFDSLMQTLTADAFARSGRTAAAYDLFRRVAPSRGAELPRRMAETARRMGWRDEALGWIEICLQTGSDPTIYGGHQSLLQCGYWADEFGEPDLAVRLFRAVLDICAWRRDRFAHSFNAPFDADLASWTQLSPRFNAMFQDR